MINSILLEIGTNANGQSRPQQRPRVRQHDQRGAGRDGSQPGSPGTPGHPLPGPCQEGWGGAARAPGYCGSADPGLPARHPQAGGDGAQGPQQGHDRPRQQHEAGEEVPQHNSRGGLQKVSFTSNFILHLRLMPSGFKMLM